MYTTTNLFKKQYEDLRFVSELETEPESTVLNKQSINNHDYAVSAQAYIVNLSC